MESIDVSIKWPFKWCLVGASGSGKSNFALQIVSQSYKLFDEPPSNVIIIYKEFQQIYNQFDTFIPTKCYYEEDVDLEELTKNNQDRLLIICDDLYFSKKLHEISEHFLIKGRHRNTSWLVLTQSIFNNTALKNISRNSTHITLFKSVRLNEPHIFFSQLRPKSSKVLQDIYREATQNSYSYLDIDLSQTCPDKYRYKSNILDKLVTVYIIMSPSTFKSMYLISKHDLEKNSSRDFKLSLENKDICDGGVNVSIKPVKNRMLKNKNSKESQTSQKQNHESTEENVRSGEIEKQNKTIQWPISHPQYKYKAERSIDHLERGMTNSPPQNKDIAERNIDNPGITINQNYALIHKPKMKKRTLKRSNFRERNASSRNVMRLKSQKVGPRIDKKQKRVKYRYDQIQQYPAISSNIQQYPAISRYPGDHLDQNSANLDQNEINLNLEPQNSTLISDQNLDNNLDRDTNLNNETNLNSGTVTDLDENVEMDNRSESGENGQDQWVGGLKSKLNDRRVQYKRKRDTVGYRINPELNDIEKSLVTPSDFKFLNEADSEEYLRNYKLLKKSPQKPYSIKKFKAY